MRTAVIDAGTNTFRLLISDFNDSGFSVACDLAETPRLGNFKNKTNMLDNNSVDFALSIISRYYELIKKEKCDKVQIFATEFLRKTADPKLFTEGVKKITGLDVRIIDRKEEAYYSFKGICLSLGLDEKGIIAADIGGGSVETAFEQDRNFYFSSDSCGCVTLNSLFEVEFPVTETYINKVKEYLKNNLKLKFKSFDCLAVSGGFITALAAVINRLDTFDSSVVHGFSITRYMIDRYIEKLKNENSNFFFDYEFLKNNRADIMPAGLLIIDYIMNFFSAEQVLVSNYGIVAGVSLELYEKRVFDN